jgi:hypothetical protein
MQRGQLGPPTCGPATCHVMVWEERRLAAALHGWGSPPFRLWASVRAYELAKAGERATIVVYFNKQDFDATQLERIGEPEYAIRRASGVVERSPVVAPPPPVRLVRRQA